MKKIVTLGLCVLIISGLAISNAPAQEKDSPAQSQEERSETIKKLTIRNSGFRSRSTVVIRYRDEDKKIVEVIENGKKLPPEEFARYEPLIHQVLEIPQIDRLLPEIDRAIRRAESPRVSEESKIRDMLALRRRLERLDSDVARRYRDINELQLMTSLNRLTEKISESGDLTQEEKIQKLREVLEEIHALELAKKEADRRSRLTELQTANIARMLIAEIKKSEEMSNQEKIKEIQELLRRERELDLRRDERRGRSSLVEFEAANTMRKMLQEITENKNLADQEKSEEFARIMKEAEKIQSEGMRRMIGIEKFKFELYLLLKKEGLLPNKKSEFILKRNVCTIDGKKLPEEIHDRILQLSEESIGKKFDKDSKIVLQLNPDF